MDSRPANVSLSIARDMQGDAVVQGDGKNRFGGGVDGFFGGAVIGEEAWEKE